MFPYSDSSKPSSCRQDARARLETAKSLSSLYANESFAPHASTVTLRLAPRLIDMALRDVDVNVRVTALHAIALIDKSGILADEGDNEREKVAQLVFDAEPKVRKAVGTFWKGLWEERVESLKSDWAGARGNKKKRAQGITGEAMDQLLEAKALATLLVDVAGGLEKSDDVGTSRAGMLLGMKKGDGTGGRAVAAVEALYAEFDILQDWERVVDYLLLDHSTCEQDMWLLNEEEEDMLLQIAIACVKTEDKVSRSPGRVD